MSLLHRERSVYQRLIKETANRSDVKLVALFPHSVTEGKQYLDELGVGIADLRQVDLRQSKLPARQR